MSGYGETRIIELLEEIAASLARIEENTEAVANCVEKGRVGLGGDYYLRTD
jgi:hypothetical protein